MPSKDEMTELEVEIRKDRRLPYTITIEKMEGDTIWTHNQWGNSVKYKKNKNGRYDMIVDAE